MKIFLQEEKDFLQIESWMLSKCGIMLSVLRSGCPGRCVRYKKRDERTFVVLLAFLEGMVYDNTNNRMM